MKAFLKRLFLVTLSALMVFSATACGDNSGDDIPDVGEDNMAQLTYPDFAETPNDKNSWEYISDDEDYTLQWYVDVSSWPIPTENSVVRAIKEKTGITVKFVTPTQDDGQKLATMIAGGKLPDIISTPTAQTQVLASLAQQGYVYDINTLADKWAPSLYNNLPQDVWDWWAYGNGKTYGIPNHYYSYEDVPEGQLQPNGGMMVRKDIFDAWQNYVETNLKDANGMVNYTSISGTPKSVEWQGYITTPEGFKAASIWAMENYYGANVDGKISTALQLAQFTNTGNASLTWLSQFFAVPFEDENGNYLYGFTQKGYQDMLLYLNDLYNTKVNGNSLISAGNFTQNYDGVGSVVAGGKAFATLVTPQDYQMHYVTAKDSGYEYISMYITNENGDAPVLADIRGYGYLFNMITTSCARPDLVIKLFDYLSSEEGQRLICFGVQGDTWDWSASDSTKIEFTQSYLDAKAKLETAKYGLMTFDLLINYQYYDNVQPRTNNGKTEDELFRTNLKRPLSIYAYDYNATHFVIDATDERFQTYNNTLTRIESTVLGPQIPKIIKASSKDEAIRLYNQAIDLMNKYNLNLVITMNSEAYQKAKQKLGVTIAWPAYKPGYVSPLDRTQPNGDLSLYRSY